jgi:hypothetical protein
MEHGAWRVEKGVAIYFRGYSEDKELGQFGIVL